jgi:hypothetical protein
MQQLAHLGTKLPTLAVGTQPVVRGLIQVETNCLMKMETHAVLNRRIVRNDSLAEGNQRGLEDFQELERLSDD